MAAIVAPIVGGLGIAVVALYRANNTLKNEVVNLVKEQRDEARSFLARGRKATDRKE